MRSVSIVAPIVALACVASAGVLPREDTECNFATGWGCWSITGLTETISLSTGVHSFSFGASYQSELKNTTCTGTLDEGLTCNDGAYKAVVDANATTLNFYEKLYQTKAVVVLGGNRTLATTCSTDSAAASTTCTQATFHIRASQVGTIFSDGTSEGFTF